MGLFLLAETWIALLTLTFLEIVLGVDNIIFISIVTNKLPRHKQQYARRVGLGIALLFRITLLALIFWMTQKLTNPLFSLFSVSFSIRELVLLAGGMFLIVKSISEINSKMKIVHEKDKVFATNDITKVIVQIILLDVVFSFDSILTAVGLTNHLSLMIIAVVISMFIMIFFASKIGRFISDHPTLEVLALAFLILVGGMLLLSGVHIEISKTYLYFAVFFSLMVELINMRIRKKHQF
jgi:predicted tellurium resistance membrane protein TerC